MTIIKCEYCDKKFEVKFPFSHPRKFCSKKCFYKRQSETFKKEIAPHYCDYCGKEIKGRSPASFKNKQNHFCNRDCCTKWRKENWKGKNAPQYRGGTKTVNCNCSQCGKTVKRLPIEIKTTKHFFCSIECKGKWHSENLIGKKAPHWQGGSINVQCETCSKPLQRMRSVVEKQDKFFCNMRCRGKWQSKHKTSENHPNRKGKDVKCFNCGKEIYIPLWHLKRQEKFFCDNNCFLEWHIPNISGENHYLWKGGRFPYYGPNWGRQRRKARKRDDYTCQNCGIAEDNLDYQLHVHHIKPLRDFNYIAGQNENYIQANKLTNLISLCRNCHRRYENKKITIE